MNGISDSTANGVRDDEAGGRPEAQLNVRSALAQQFQRPSSGRQYDRHEAQRHVDLRDVDLPGLIEELTAPRGLHPKYGRDVESSRFPCPSPSHEQTGRSPPLKIRMGRDGHHVWYCHTCGVGGHAAHALVHAGQARDLRDAFDQLGGERFDYLEQYAAKRTRRPPSRSAANAPPTPEQVAEAQGALASYLEHCRRRLSWEEAAEARRWLRARGLTDAEVAAHGIGYDPGSRKLRRPKETLPRPRTPAVTFPLFDEAGRVVYAQARQLEPEDDGPKYLNPYTEWIGPNPRVGVIRRPRTADRSVLVVTEGICDGILAGRHFEARAIIGAGLPDAAVAERLIKAAAGRPIVICFDSDKAGRDGAKTLLNLISERGGRAASVRVPAKDLSALRLKAGDGFEYTFRGLVANGVERIWSAEARARGDPPTPSTTDPLDRYRHLLGLRRTGRLEAHVAARVDDFAQRDLEWLQLRRAELGEPFQDLDRAGALKTLRLERRRDVLAARIAVSRSELTELDEELARTTLRLIEQDEQRIAHLDAEERQLRVDDQHLDTWLDSNFRAVAEWLALERAISRHEAIERFQDPTERAAETALERLPTARSAERPTRVAALEVEM